MTLVITDVTNELVPFMQQHWFRTDLVAPILASLRSRHCPYERRAGAVPIVQHNVWQICWTHAMNVAVREVLPSMQKHPFRNPVDSIQAVLSQMHCPYWRCAEAVPTVHAMMWRLCWTEAIHGIAEKLFRKRMPTHSSKEELVATVQAAIARRHCPQGLCDAAERSVLERITKLVVDKQEAERAAKREAELVAKWKAERTAKREADRDEQAKRAAKRKAKQQQDALEQANRVTSRQTKRQKALSASTQVQNDSVALPWRT